MEQSALKPALHLLTVWRIRLLLAALAPSFLSAYFLPWQGILWWCLTAGWVLGFLYFYIAYYPIKLRKLAYSGNEHCLIIHCGVVYTRVKAIPYTSIQYASLFSTPLERLFGICSLAVSMAGARVYMPGLTRNQAKGLQEQLVHKSEGASA